MAQYMGQYWTYISEYRTSNRQKFEGPRRKNLSKIVTAEQKYSISKPRVFIWRLYKFQVT